jgi:hypothetical protein
MERIDQLDNLFFSELPRALDQPGLRFFQQCCRRVMKRYQWN